MTNTKEQPTRVEAEPVARPVVLVSLFDRLTAIVNEYVRFADPGADQACLVFWRRVSSAERSSVSVPVTAIEQPLPERVVAFVSRVSGWVKAKVIAAEVDADADGGKFRGVMAQLVKDGALESGALGYRIKNL